MAEAIAARDAEVTGIDPAAKAIEAARGRATSVGQSIRYDVGFGENLPYDDESFDTVAYTAFVVANADVDEDLVYKVTKATYDCASRDFLVNSIKAWGIGLDAAEDGGFLEQIKAFGLELHPGAARYWKERGLMN